MSISALEAEPAALAIERPKTALLIMDMSRDFLEPGGFGGGNDVSRLQTAAAPCRDVPAAARPHRSPARGAGRAL